MNSGLEYISMLDSLGLRLDSQPNSDLFFLTNWSFNQSHLIFSYQIFFKADRIGQKIN